MPHDVFTPPPLLPHLAVRPVEMSPLLAPPTVRFVAHNTDADRGWRVARARFVDSLGELPAVTLTLASDDPVDDPHALLRHACTVSVRRESERPQLLAGIITRVSHEEQTARRRVARVTILPSLWKLAQRQSYRVFHDKTVVEVVRSVLRKAKIYQRDGALALRLGARVLRRREVTTQYAETDLNFILRLLEGEGLLPSFEALDPDGNGEAQEVLVISDPAGAPGSETGGAVAPVDRFALNRRIEGVFSASLDRQVAPAAALSSGHNFTNPYAPVRGDARTRTRDASASVHHAHSLGITLHDWSGDDDEAPTHRAHEAERHARTTLAQLRSDARTLHGEGDVTAFRAGRAFALRGHARAELDQDYLLTRVEHDFDLPEALGDDAPAAPRGEAYLNRWTAVRADLPWLPRPRARRPVVHGPHTATVAAAPGTDEEICVDAHGRVLVRFHWDLRATDDARRARRPSGWVRVSQPLAGARWGALFVPRVGMEVVVQFLDGDPDRPLITGCVYNGTHRPPQALREHKTRTTLRTQTTPGGDGYHELTFDDARGRELMFLRAERDQEVLVRHDARVTIGNDRTEHIKGDQRVVVKGGERVDVQGADGATLRVAHEYTLTAGERITLRCGASVIEMTPEGVSIRSPTVSVSGGAAASLSGGSTLTLSGGQVHINP